MKNINGIPEQPRQRVCESRKGKLEVWMTRFLVCELPAWLIPLLKVISPQAVQPAAATPLRDSRHGAPSRGLRASVTLTRDYH